MRVDQNRLKNFILDAGLSDEQTLAEISQECEENDADFADILIEKKIVTEEQLRQIYSLILGIPFVNLEKEVIARDILQIIPEPIAKKYKIVAFKKDGNDLRVAMLRPDDIQTIDFIKKKTGLRIHPCISSETGIENVLRQYEQSLKAEFGDIIDKNAQDITDEESL